jgi:hypothetical protein
MESDKKNIPTGITGLDKIMEGGLPTGKLSYIIGQPTNKTSFIKFLPVIDNPSSSHMITMSLENSEEITKKGICLIREMLDKLKENGIDLNTIKPCIHKNEKFGDTWFPVTYYEDGTVIVDYPDRLFCQTIKDKQNVKGA